MSSASLSKSFFSSGRERSASDAFSTGSNASLSRHEIDLSLAFSLAIAYCTSKCQITVDGDAETYLNIPTESANTDFMEIKGRGSQVAPERLHTCRPPNEYKTIKTTVATFSAC